MPNVSLECTAAAIDRRQRRRGFAAGGIKGAVLGREAMAAVEKATTSTAWATVSAAMKKKLADALASGDTATIVDLTSRITSAQAAQSSEERSNFERPLG